MTNGKDDVEKTEDCEEAVEGETRRDRLDEKAVPKVEMGTMKFVQIGCSRLVAEKDEDNKHQQLSFLSDSWNLRKINKEYMGHHELTLLINFFTELRSDL